MKIKNVAKGNRGIGVAGHDPIEWKPGEVKDVDAAVIKAAKQDPANAAMLTEEGGLVEIPETNIVGRVTVNDDGATGGEAPVPAPAKAVAKK